MSTLNDEYIDFASKISFFEFIQDEFRNADIDIKQFYKEIALLKTKQNWNINELSDFIRQNPRSFIIFQEIFQLLRFTNAQVIHFIFDIAKLNSPNLEAIFEYMILNIKYDEDFRKIYLNLIEKGLSYNSFVNNIDHYDRKYLIAIFKLAISKYVTKISRNFNILEKHITKSEFGDFSIRFSNYLLTNLKMNETLESIRLENFLIHKKTPIDTKSLHGKYPKIKITKALEDSGFTRIDNILDGWHIKTLSGDIRKQVGQTPVKAKRIFCTERYVEGIVKRDGKPKKLDLIIFNNYKPKYLFEINFYSTEGTKIGINQNEYIDLNNYLQQNYKDMEFYWITDGNYWLSPQGRTRFINLLEHFSKVYNINTFKENLDNFKQ